MLHDPLRTSSNKKTALSIEKLIVIYILHCLLRKARSVGPNLNMRPALLRGSTPQALTLNRWIYGLQCDYTLNLQTFLIDLNVGLYLANQFFCICRAKEHFTEYTRSQPNAVFPWSASPSPIPPKSSSTHRRNCATSVSPRIAWRDFRSPGRIIICGSYGKSTFGV